MANRTFAVGDIHGDLEALLRVIGKLPALDDKDTLLFLGDYMDRGMQSAQVIDFLRNRLPKQTKARVVTLRGNHEDGWLRVIEGGWPEFVGPEGNGCLACMRSFIGKSYAPGDHADEEDMRAMLSGSFFPKDVVAWIQNLPYWYEDEHAIYVHAGLPFHEGKFLHPSQVEHKAVLLWVRTMQFFLDYRGKLIVVGHTSTDNLPPELSSFTPEDPLDMWVGENVIVTDTGCGKGGFLTCLELPREANVRVAVSDLTLPHKFGSYILFDKIGQGGMAELYLGRNTSGKLLVVKLILPVYAERPEFATMLADEAKLAATLSHANVVQVVDLGKEDGRLFIAMEYVEGFDLSALLKRCSKEKVPLPPEFAFHIVTELLAALDYAHKKKVVHRDVSPSNVLVSFDGEVKLCDFGIARANLAATAEGEQPTEAIKGKAGYMSPEHARGDVIDGRADVFAAGIILWELLAGKKLYRASADAGDLIEQARAAKIPELPSRDLPDEEKLHAIVKRALASDRDERYATAADMRRELAEWTSKAKLGANAIKLGDWLAEHFGKELVAQRAARESASKSLESSPKPARALLTPEPPRITYKDDGPALNEEASPESLSPIDISPPSRMPAPEPAKPTPWGIIVTGVVIVGVIAWLLSR